jgi:hypothetical protein
MKLLHEAKLKGSIRAHPDTIAITKHASSKGKMRDCIRMNYELGNELLYEVIMVIGSGN